MAMVFLGTMTTVFLTTFAQRMEKMKATKIWNWMMLLGIQIMGLLPRLRVVALSKFSPLVLPQWRGVRWLRTHGGLLHGCFTNNIGSGPFGVSAAMEGPSAALAAMPSPLTAMAAPSSASVAAPADATTPQAAVVPFEAHLSAAAPRPSEARSSQGADGGGTGVFTPVVYRRRGATDRRGEGQVALSSPSPVSRESHLQLLLGCGYSLEAASRAVGRTVEFASSPPVAVAPVAAPSMTTTVAPVADPRRSARLSGRVDADEDSMVRAQKLVQQRNLDKQPGFALMYQLAAIMGVATEGAAQGTDGVWRQATRVDHQGVYVPVWVAC
ncbi:hypothetical protein BRADI_3g35344v3 [Brachypodium distachyon]|uniref:Uncharacterized protein n=1 Tax=Brachypodium distachyon TaxID=15368 RepID=A0A2K2D1B9_BRADI|nr:hypothetical protein BRADI_3g35344v3 [Brachypodium distachyon]